TDKPVVVYLGAVVSAFIMGAFGLIWLDSRIDGQVADEVAKAQLTFSHEFSVIAKRGKDELTSMGAHKACFLTGSQDENDEEPAVAICKVVFEGGEWRLKARGAWCNAACID